MTADQRHHIRAARDQHQRHHLAQAAYGYRCAGCHGDRENHTKGCQACNDRHQRRRNRARNRT